MEPPPSERTVKGDTAIDELELSALREMLGRKVGKSPPVGRIAIGVKTGKMRRLRLDVAVWLQNPEKFIEGLLQIGEMFQNLFADNEVKGVFLERIREAGQVEDEISVAVRV